MKNARKTQENIYFIEDTKSFDSVDHNKLWKILEEMRIPGHLTCFLRNLYGGHEATVRNGHVLVLYWTGTRVDNERVKEGKRLIFPGLHSQLSCSRESVRNREIEREKERRGPKL